MSLFSITVKNNETGEVMQFYADVLTLSAAEIAKDGVISIYSGIEDPVTMAKAAIGVDQAKEDLLARNPFAKVMYHYANLFFSKEEIGGIQRDSRNGTSD